MSRFQAHSPVYARFVSFMKLRARLERGVGLVEVLVAGAVLAIVILGSTVVFSTQKQTVSKDLGTDALRDILSNVNIDAAAIQGYDPAAHTALSGSQPQNWIVLFGGAVQSSSVSVIAKPSASGLSIIAQGAGQQASLSAPLPLPQAAPQ